MLRNIKNQLQRIFVFTAMKVILWSEWLTRYKLSRKRMLCVKLITSRYGTLRTTTHLIRQMSPWL